MIKGKFFRLLFWIWSVLIFIFSVIPYQDKLVENEEEGRIIRLDYIEHLIVFFILSLLFVFWKRGKIKLFNRLILFYIFISLFFSILMEVVQLYIPNRTFNVIDMIFNSSGIILGLFLSWVFLKSDVKPSYKS